MSALDPTRRELAEALARELLMYPPHSPEFCGAVSRVQVAGRAAQLRLGASPVQPDLGQMVPADLVQALEELRGLLTALEPVRPGWWGAWRGEALQGPSAAVAAGAAAQAGALLHRVYAGQDALGRSRLMLRREALRLDGQRGELESALAFVAELERLLQASLPVLEARQPLHAAALQQEALLVLRGRRRDLSESLAVAAQARLALEVLYAEAAALEEALGGAAEAARAAVLLSQAAAAGGVPVEQLLAALKEARAALDRLQSLPRKPKGETGQG